MNCSSSTIPQVDDVSRSAIVYQFFVHRNLELLDLITIVVQYYLAAEPLKIPISQQEKEKTLLKLYINFGVLTRLGYQEETVLKVSTISSALCLARSVKLGKLKNVVSMISICFRVVSGSRWRERRVGGRARLGECTDRILGKGGAAHEE
jgi:hypothetical protein